MKDFSKRGEIKEKISRHIQISDSSLKSEKILFSILKAQHFEKNYLLVSQMER